MTIYGYARVSTAGQERGGTSLTTQSEQLTTAGATHIVCEVMSGAVANRPKLDELLGTLQAGDTLLVCRFDRLARSTRHLLDIVDTLNGRGVHFRSLHEQIDTTTPQGKLFLTLMGALGEFERELIKERTQQGIQRYRDNGGLMGRPPIVQDRLALARELLGRGETYTQVAKKTGISRSSLYRHCKLLP